MPATAGDDAIRVWDLASGRLSTEMGGHVDPAGPLSISRDGRWLAMCGSSGAIWIWDVSHRTITAMTRVDAQPDSRAWSPDGRHLYAGGSHRLYRFEFRRPPGKGQAGVASGLH